MSYLLRLAFILAFMLATAAAHSADTCRPKEEAARVAQVLSNAGFRQMTKARDAIDINQPEAALALLDEIQRENRFSEFDKAKALQVAATVYVGQNRIDHAIASSEAARACGVLDQYSNHELLYNLAHFYSYNNQFEKSAAALQLWFGNEQNPGAQAYFTMAQVYAQLDNMAQALRYAEQGLVKHQQDIADAKTNGQAAIEPRESWHRVVLAVRLENNKITDAIALLHFMLAQWPAQRDYYLQLSALYQQQQQELEALLVLAAAQHAGLIINSKDIDRLAQQYRYHQIPIAAATLWEKDLAARETNSVEAWKYLGDANAQAREWAAARAAYLKAAAQASDGKLWLMLCQTAFREAEFSEAKSYCNQAIAKKGLQDSTGLAWQLLANSHYQLQERDAALQAFAQCAAVAETRKVCGDWQAHIQTLQTEDREEQLRQQAALAAGVKQQSQHQESVDDLLKLF